MERRLMLVLMDRYLQPDNHFEVYGHKYKVKIMVLVLEMVI